jgi:protein-disulfide isomerase
MKLLSMVGLAVLMLTTMASTRAQTRLAAAEITALKALGSKSAPITIEVFSDFQCPACRRTFEDTLRPVIDNYVTIGKVYLVHRDFPLPMHTYSREAARWANAAAQVGKFEKVEAALYAKQDTWSTNGKIEPVVAAVLSAAELKKVRQLVQSGQLDAAIDRDVDLGKSRGVNQTPTLFVTKGGETEKLTSGVTYSLLKQYLDYLLKK